MAELLRYLTAYEGWIYVCLGVIGIIYLRKGVVAFQEWRVALFGLEKNLAQRKLGSAVGIVFLLVLLIAGEFITVSFIIPNYPSLSAIATPTLDLYAQPTTTLAPQLAGTFGGTGTPSATEEIVSSPENCLPGQLDFTSPKAGDTLKASDGIIILHGMVTVPANFGYYKYEYTTVGNQDWITIQAGDKIRCLDKKCVTATDDPGDTLGQWDISQLKAGDYLLRLISTDNNGASLPACQIQIRVTTP